MEKTIWKAGETGVTINFTGSYHEFRKMIYVMLRHSPDLCANLTGEVAAFWHEAGVNTGDLPAMIEKKPANE
jgi:hypothetical protein